MEKKNGFTPLHDPSSKLVGAVLRSKPYEKSPLGVGVASL
jgi:hypothetical protein